MQLDKAKRLYDQAHYKDTTNMSKPEVKTTTVQSVMTSEGTVETQDGAKTISVFSYEVDERITLKEAQVLAILALAEANGLCNVGSFMH